MTVEIRDKKDIVTAKKIIDQTQPDKKFDAYIFCGVLKFDEDPKTIKMTGDKILSATAKG